jgi:hypothetical protein
VDVLSGPVTLHVGGAQLGVLDNQLVAFLVPPIRAEEWIITPVPQHGENAVVVEKADRSAGWVLPDQQAGTPVAVTPLIAGVSEPPHFPPNEVWLIAPLTEESDLAPNTAAFTLCSQLAGEGQYIGRHQIEDRSLRPKRIMLLPEGMETMPFVAIASTAP